MRTVVYIDGYNLYYGLLRKTSLKWLDLFALFRDHVLDPDVELVQVLQALRKMYPEQIAIIEGKIIASTPFQRLVKPIPEAPTLERVQVYDFNEKKTDVNLAADLIAGAWTGAYEQAVVCSNDTDLEAAVAAVRRHHPGIRLGLVAPIPGNDHRRISTDLSQHAHWSKPLSPVHLEKAQLPERIPHLALRKPEGW